MPKNQISRGNQDGVGKLYVVKGFLLCHAIMLLCPYKPSVCLHSGHTTSSPLRLVVFTIVMGYLHLGQATACGGCDTMFRHLG